MKGMYLRISDDAAQTGLGVSRQREDCQRLASDRGWVLQEYADNDTSAYDRKVVRARFEEMLRDLREGVLDGIVVYNLDRLARQPRDLERLIDIYEETPHLTFSTVEGDLNLSSADGRTMARVMIAFANKSSADTGRRTQRKHVELAKAGKPVGRRTFGWEQDLTTLHPVEAEYGRKVISLVLDERYSPRMAADWLNQQGVTTSYGNPWTHIPLRKWLRNPRLAGYRTMHGEILTDDTGRPVEGLWEPLISKDDWDRLQLAVGKQDGTRIGAQRSLLGGLLRCGICNGRMYASRQVRELSSGEVKEKYLYRCRGEVDKHLLSITAKRTDDLVTELMFRRLEQEDLEAPAPEWAGEASLEAVNTKIAELMDAFLGGKLSQQVVFPRVQALEKQRDEMQNARNRWLIETTGPGTEHETRESWSGLSATQQRAVLRRLFDAIYVTPSKQPNAGFDPDRLRPVWRG